MAIIDKTFCVHEPFTIVYTIVLLLDLCVQVPHYTTRVGTSP